MISQEVETINELMEQLKEGKIEGSIEIIINNKGKANRILIRKQDEETESAVKRVQLRKPDLSHADFSGMIVNGSNFSGVDLHEANFSYSAIENANLAGSYLRGAVFYKSSITQSDMSNSFGANTQGAYITGSVNLYNAQSAAVEAPNHYDGIPRNMGSGWVGTNEYGEHTMDMSHITVPNQRRNW